MPARLAGSKLCVSVGLASPRLAWPGLAWSDLAGLLWLRLWLWLWSVSVCATATARVSARVRVSSRTSYISFKQEHATNAVQRQRDFLPGAGPVRATGTTRS